jgi:transcriptional regulator with XRE-family HTH domain
VAASVKVDGAKIEHLRKYRANLTRKQMATALGISQPALYYIERGKQRTSVGTLQRIAAMFGESPETFERTWLTDEERGALDGEVEEEELAEVG